MLDIQCQEYLDEVKAFANKTKQMENLSQKLEYLDGYADRETTRCELRKDFAPMSFAFAMYKKQPDGTEKYWFQGGVIYFEAGDVGYGAPNFSVRIGDTSKSGWAIHT